jgi:hypothetical protein
MGIRSISFLGHVPKSQLFFRLNLGHKFVQF